MLRKLLIFLLIYLTKCECSYSVENLYTILDQTTEYFKNLSNAYNETNINLSNNVNNSINGLITKYMEDTTKIILRRQRRSLQNNLQTNKGANVLQSFEEIASINLPDFQDIAFISIQDEDQLFWLAAAIDSSKLLLYQFVNNTAQLMGTYWQSNGKRIIVNNYNNGIFIIIQKDTDEIVVFYTCKNKNNVYELNFKQAFEIDGVTDVTMWFGMNQLYLGIASNTEVFIYAWFQEYFDKIDSFNFGAKKILFFQHKGVMHIFVIGSLTRMFRFSVRSNKFVLMQKFHDALDVSSFYFKEDHSEERFLILASDKSTILYKELYNRFLPFQEIAPGRYVYSLKLGNTVILLVEKENNADIYQYNGWKFVKLPTLLSNIRQIYKIVSYEEDTLVVQNQDKEWKFLRPIWIVKKTPQVLQNEINAWCSEIKRKASQRMSVNLPNLKNPIEMSNVHIDQLRAQNINNENATELINLTQQYKKTIAKLNLVNSTLVQAISAENPKYIILHGKKITVKCETKCYVRHIDTNSKINFLKLEDLEHINQTLEFSNLKVNMMNNWKCPIPNFNIDDIFVKGFINGISMQDLQERTLKVSGDQEISGKHIFTNLYTKNALIPMNIATHSINQTVLMNQVKVKELNITESKGYLLPLNGPVTEMTGSITVSKVKVTGLVELRGGIKGKGTEKFKPIKEILTPLFLPYNDYFLENVTFRNFIKVKDIIRPHEGLSLKEILVNSIPLDSNLPEHLILSSDKTQWNNVTLLDYKNWITKNSTKTVIISGTKFADNNVILTDASYVNLPTPKLTIPLCAMEVITQDIRTSSITVDDLIVENLHVSHVFGAHNLNDTLFNSVSALHNIDFSTKLFTGKVFVRNISASEIRGTDIKDLKIEMNKWIDVDHLRGPINIPKLTVDNLETPAIFVLPFPKRVKNVIIKGDSVIEKINGINISSLMENAVKVHDVLSLENLTFLNGFMADSIYASQSTLDLSLLEVKPLNLHSKRISSDLKTNAINIPQTFEYVPDNSPSIFVIHGMARFIQEPTVQEINNINLEELSKDLWMSNQDTVLSGSMAFGNITIRNSVAMHHPMNSLNAIMWLDLSKRLLSKTKQQSVTGNLSFKNVEASAIVEMNNSVVHSSDPNLKDLLINSLMRNKTQTVDAVWHFEELNTDNLNWNGKFNNIDLNKDIVRYNAEQNIITGTKTIINLRTKDLWSYNKNFSNWAKNALLEKCQKTTIIKGRKIFNNVTLNNLSIKGKLMGRNVEEALLKSGNQTIHGFKKIQGNLHIAFLITDSTVNDVNLTQLIKDQVKKHEALQTIQTIDTKIDFRNDLEVYGNITINGLYSGIDLTNISKSNKLDDILNRTTRVMELTKEIKTAFHNPAIYINKFEAIDENTLEITSNLNTENNVIILNNTCLCDLNNNSFFCNDTKLLNISTDVNSGTFIMTKRLLLDNTVFVVTVLSDFVSIYIYSAAEQELYQKAGLYVSNILRASVEPADHSLWIILQLSEQTLLLHYTMRDEIEQYVLPASDTFVTSKTPNNQHLLIRSDGVWNLDDMLHPEHIFKMPLYGEIKTFAFGSNYYIKTTTDKGTAVYKARYVGN